MKQLYLYARHTYRNQLRLERVARTEGGPLNPPLVSDTLIAELSRSNPRLAQAVQARPSAAYFAARDLLEPRK